MSKQGQGDQSHWSQPAEPGVELCSMSGIWLEEGSSLPPGSPARNLASGSQLVGMRGAGGCLPGESLSFDWDLLLFWPRPPLSHCELWVWEVEGESEPWRKCHRLLLNFNTFSCINVSSFVVYSCDNF